MKWSNDKRRPHRDTRNISIYLSICLSVCLSAFLSIYISTYLSTCMYTYTYKYHMIYMSISMSTSTSLESICLSYPVLAWPGLASPILHCPSYVRTYVYRHAFLLNLCAWNSGSHTYLEMEKTSSNPSAKCWKWPETPVQECHAALVLVPSMQLTLKTLHRLAAAHVCLKNSWEAVRCLRNCILEASWGRQRQTAWDPPWSSY